MDPLHEILLGDHKNILQSLLEKSGKDYFQHREIEDERKELLPPIDIAVSIGSAVIVAQFIQAGIDINLDRTLYHAVRNEHGHVVRLLLDYKSVMNFTIDGSEGSLLHSALWRSKENDSIALMLLDHGVNYNYVYECDSTPLHMAAENGCVTVVERLLSLGHMVDKKNISGCTPLHVASNKDVIRVLLAAGANANARDNHDWTPLHKAAEKGVAKGINLLLRSGANISALTDDGSTALHVAPTRTTHDSAKIIKLLLDIGLGVNDRFRRGSSPLHDACSVSGVKAAALLLMNGVDVKAKDNEGTAPFQLATRGRVPKATVDLVSLLVDHGADVNTQDDKGFTALHHVKTYDDNFYPGFSYQYLSVDIAELPLDHGVDVDARDAEGKTALFGFLKRGQLAGAELFIKRGADVKVLRNHGETMLHGIADDTLSLCPILLERGVDVNALTIHGCSPLALALPRYCTSRVAKLLVKKGGKNIRN
jgi:ankyrin repeat protein